MKIREAAISDMPLLSAHHRMMFEEIWLEKGQRLDPEAAAKIEAAYAEKLASEMPGGVCRAWVMEDGGQPVSSCAITNISLTPNPYDLSSRVVFLHSVFTEKTHRNRGCAQTMVRAAEEWCRENGIRRIILSASDAGRPVYRKLGFCDAPEMMRLFIEIEDTEEAP
ncbi:MAG: GNAT family N-acetyltransferase [Deltaproteobacteria bacterium]|nr:GNAT family N-acetyltransferase [Deltaproteobacteria bacterium]